MLKVREIMTCDVLTLAPDATLREAVALLAQRHVSGAPVVAGGKVVGVVSMTDILDFEASTPPVPAERAGEAEWGAWDEEPRAWETESEPAATYFSELWADVGAELDERFATVESPEWDQLGEHTVSEVMTRQLCWVAPDAEVPRAADYMRRAGVHRVLVIDKGELVGILTAMDVARAVAEHKLYVRRYVFDRRGGDEDRYSEF